MFCLNLISSPGSGKTSLPEYTFEGFGPERRIAMLTGDIQTDSDVRRVQPDIEILDVSCTTSEGLDRWRAWLDRHL